MARKPPAPKTTGKDIIRRTVHLEAPVQGTVHVEWDAEAMAFLAAQIAFWNVTGKSLAKVFLQATARCSKDTLSARNALIRLAGHMVSDREITKWRAAQKKLVFTASVTGGTELEVMSKDSVARLRAIIIEELIDRGESLLDMAGVSESVAGEIADAIVGRMATNLSMSSAQPSTKL